MRRSFSGPWPGFGISLALLFLIPPANVCAQQFSRNATAKDAVRLLESKYQHARALRATFFEQYSENGRVLRAEAGVAYFRRPGKMRWEYESPEKNLFLVDGKNAWFYVPADRTVTRVPARESEDWRTPLALLAGQAKLSRVCSAIAVAADVRALANGDSVLRCTLRGGEKEAARAGKTAAAAAAEEDVLLEINETNGELSRVLIRQRGGVEIEFKFANWQLNAAVPDSQFRFSPPQGVAIVDGEGLSAGPNRKN